MILYKEILIYFFYLSKLLRVYNSILRVEFTEPSRLYVESESYNLRHDHY